MVRAYLARPKRHERTEGEPSIGGGCSHLREGGSHRNGEGSGKTRLDLDLGHLPRAKSNVGEEFSGGGTSQPNEALVLFAGLFTGQVHVGIFEDLIETVLEGSLEGVTD